MKKLGFAATVATGLAAAVIGLAAPAGAAPTGTGSAADTIASLESSGNQVVVNNLSGAPLDEAKVVAVHPGPVVKDWVWDASHEERNQQRNVGRVYYVDVR